MQKLFLVMILSFLVTSLFAANQNPPQAVNYLKPPAHVMRVSRTEKPPVATTEVTINLNLDALAVVTDDKFDPNDAETYNYQTDFVIYDSLGANHILSLYYVKHTANSWDMYPYVDGIFAGDTGQAYFGSSGELSFVTGTESLIFNPQTGAVSPQVFKIKFDGSTQYASKYRLRSFKQNGSPNDPDYARRK